MKKIMFNSKHALDRGVIEGWKTMTRIIIPEKLFDKWVDYDNFCNSINRDDFFDYVGFNGPKARQYYNEKKFFVEYSPYKVGEVIAIAQSYEDCGYDPNFMLDGEPISKHPGWNNKMFVEAGLMKHFIKITGVKVERLQNISDEDCLREGIEEHLKGVQYGFPSNVGYVCQYPFATPREAFAALIDRVSGKGSWKSNPWVWVYEFELIKNK